MKKKIIILVCVAIICSFCACEKKTVEHHMVDAKTEAYSTLEEVEAASDVIVKGVRKQDETPVVKESDSKIVSGYTFSDFEVTEIYLDKTDGLDKGDIVTILENEIYYEKGNIVYHVAGYNMMKSGKEYLLFLNKYTADKVDYYVSVGVNFGTVSLEEDGRMLPQNVTIGQQPDYSDYEPIWNEAREKYKIQEK